MDCQLGVLIVQYTVNPSTVHVMPDAWCNRVPVGNELSYRCRNTHLHPRDGFSATTMGVIVKRISMGKECV